MLILELLDWLMFLFLDSYKHFHGLDHQLKIPCIYCVSGIESVAVSRPIMVAATRPQMLTAVIV